MNKLVILSAKWCRPCVSLKKLLEEYNKTHFPQINYEVFDIEDSGEGEEMAHHFNIQGAPTLIFSYEGGFPYYIHTGTATIDEILAKLKE